MTDWRSGASKVVEIARRVDAATHEGEALGPELLRLSIKSMHRLMRAEERFRSFGALHFLLKHARSEFETSPRHAFEITSAVVDVVDRVDGPSRIHAIGLRGLAWKEHANACEGIGDLRAAREAAIRAVDTYGEESVLQFDQARARLVLCKIYREMGDADGAMQLARNCVATFSDFGDLALMNMARMVEAAVLFAAKRYGEALPIFLAILTEAERSDDRWTIARCLQCAASSARELQDLVTARDFYSRALAHFEALDDPAEANLSRWGLALTLSSDPKKLREAVSELYKARAVFATLGMNSRAACVSLDIVRLRFDAGQDVRQLCTELVTFFGEAGMTQNALEALAYLREQATLGELSEKKITRVRTFFDALPTTPMLLFVALSREDEEKAR